MSQVRRFREHLQPTITSYPLPLRSTPSTLGHHARHRTVGCPDSNATLQVGEEDNPRTSGLRKGGFRATSPMKMRRLYKRHSRMHPYEYNGHEDENSVQVDPSGRRPRGGNVGAEPGLTSNSQTLENVRMVRSRALLACWAVHCSPSGHDPRTRFPRTVGRVWCRTIIPYSYGAPADALALSISPRPADNAAGPSQSTHAGHTTEACLAMLIR